MSESNSSNPKFKVSVIVVVHSAYLPHLGSAVDHLKTNRAHELIIVGKGCYVEGGISIPNTTLSDAANIGIQSARGEYIVRVDADDWVDSELIKLESKYLDENPDIDCVWCDYIEMHPHDEGDGYQVFEMDYSPQDELEHACGAMFRKSVWKDLGGYNPDLRYQEAFDFWSRFHLQGYKAERLEVPLYLYRKGHNSMSTNPERDKVRKELEDKYAGN